MMNALKKGGSFAAVILLGFALACNYHLLILDNAFAPSGLSGIATMIQYKCHFNIGYFTLLLNLPLCLLSYFVLGRRFAFRNLVFCLSFSGSMLLLTYTGWLVPYAYNTGYSALLGPLAAGAVSGFISGTLVRLDATTGGTDIIASLIHKKDPDFSLFSIIFTLNALVAAASYFVYDYRFEPVILCLLYSLISCRIGHIVIRGAQAKIKYEIVTKDYEALREDILHHLRHSATVLDAKGLYSGEDTHLIVCLVNLYQVPQFRAILARYPGTFAYSSPIGEVLGNFKYIDRKNRFADIRAHSERTEAPSLRR